ncbi:MAG: DUF2461 domain-containing protein [Salinibacter sp.]|uniref:DUF2461 domain-containing protein n=1 Tax=Salinibacter sp. TaxID=2065818 RepID=UPI0035D40EF5
MEETFSLPPFPGFRPQAFQFLRDLEANNEREWFKARKEIYEEDLKAPLELLLADGARRLAEAELPLTAHPKRSTFRIYRDMRFTDDERPYKTNLGAVFDRSGERARNGVVYVHVEPGNSFLGAGFYQPSVSYLRPIRQRIVDQPDTFSTLLDEMASRGLPPSSMDDTLTGMPRGFSDYRDTDLAPYLKWKHFVVRRKYADDALQSPSFVDEVVRMTRDVRPLLQFVWEVESAS